MPGQWLAIPLAATDPDAPQNAPTYARNHTSGAITATGARAASFGRTPTCPDPGPHVIRFTASGGAGGTDSEDAVVTVALDSDRASA